MVQVVVVRIRVDVAQRHAVDFGVGQRPHDLRLQTFLVLDNSINWERLGGQGRYLVIPVKWLPQVLRHFVVEGLREEPFHGRPLLGLQR